MKKLYFLLLLSIISVDTSRATASFFNPTHSSSASSFERGKDQSICFSFSYSTTKKGFNQHHQEVSLSDIYGTFNMNKVGNNSKTNVTLPSPTDDPLNVHNILQALNALDGTSTFGYLNFTHTMRLFELEFAYRYFFSHNTSCSLQVPLKEIVVESIEFNDLTPEVDAGGFDKTNANWTNFLATFDTILALYELDKKRYKQMALGDIKLSFEHMLPIGKQERATLLLQIGASLPTGLKKDENMIFSLPHGYSGHTGIFGRCATEWVFSPKYTLESSLFVLHFFDRKRSTRVKTDPVQSGMIKLAKTEVKESLGTIVQVGSRCIFTLREDQVWCSLGYSFSTQTSTNLIPLDTTNFDETTINTDPMLHRWYTHNIHFKATYGDILPTSKYVSDWKLSFECSKPLYGKYTTSTHVMGGSYSLGLIVPF